MIHVTIRTVIRSTALFALISAIGCDGAPRAGQGAAVAQTGTATWLPEPKPDLPSFLTTGAHPAGSDGSAGLDTPDGGADGMPLSSAKHMALKTRDVRMPTDWNADYRWNGKERVAHAKTSKGEEVQALFDQAGVTYPPHDVLFRVFKKEREFEVWAGDKDVPMKLIATYGICAASGILGPKRREGDMQVPEGYYKVGYYYPMSSYYLSAQVNYPNESDKVRGGPALGGDILIHGNCASIGCVSMSDERIEEIYLVGWSAFLNGRPTNIHIFPSRDIDTLLSDDSLKANHAFWREIEPGLTEFDKTHRVPSVRIEADGRYVITPAT